ncbi:LYR motif-containing protein 1 [Heterostelium album PN500]|uniref:LYR motif-containing protein 1 n=1 Tax=Heterostelium pallidum (strain ATCC 26659 / Pp 5 / PN500) TaxID=670386 RepID=D3B329_HETP5|nr:LYR motif-containing protein 1 [Heterostelium album PN500]EFA83727.1 LYR motif-containing protein 1 [Heterostelium album PN500]|eukprot:XP_020435844.1 LYR motif-containing protein 1 [Heterostelium album PN500]
MDLRDPVEIEEKIEEARSRMLLAAHYRIPFAKKSYAPKSEGVMPKTEDPNSESNIC